VADKATRRRFTAAYKRRIVREADKCTKPGELGALLRREGVYSSSLSTWRQQLDAGDLSGTGAKRGPKAQPKDPRDKRIAQLERETRRLERKLEQAETVIGIQKKVASLLGIPLKNMDDEENS
jgi:transposase-like protein